MACQGQNRILEMITGRPWDEENIFSFEKVVLNLPCSQGYDASLPRVMKLNKRGELAPGKAVYVDDIRIGARGEADARGAEERHEAVGVDLLARGLPPRHQGAGQLPHLPENSLTRD